MPRLPSRRARWFAASSLRWYGATQASSPSGLIALVEAGEVVVIARAGKPVAQLASVNPIPDRVFGGLALRVPESFFHPLPEPQLASWE